MTWTHFPGDAVALRVMVMKREGHSVTQLVISVNGYYHWLAVPL